MSAGSQTDKAPAARRPEGRLGVAGWFWAGRYWIERHAYILHRISGLALVLYLVMHVYVTGERARGQAAWEAVMGKLDNPFFKIGEFLVLLAFIYHAVNGLRLVVVELGFLIGKPAPPTYPYKTSIRAQRPFMYVLMAAAAVFVAISIKEFFGLF